jgi:hypothetical protein
VAASGGVGRVRVHILDVDNRTQAAAGRIAIRLRLLASGRDGIAPRLLAEFSQLGCLVADAVNVIRARRDCSDQDSFHKVDVVDADPEGDTRSVSDSLPVVAVGKCGMRGNRAVEGL